MLLLILSLGACSEEKEGDERGSEEEEDSADDERNLRLSSLGLIKMREEVSLLHRTPARSTSSL